MEKNLVPQNLNSSISLFEKSNFSIQDLKNPTILFNIISDIKKISSKKRKLGIRDFHILLTKVHSDEEITTSLSTAIREANKDTAISIWELCNAKLKYDLVVLEDSVLNIDIIKKIDIDGLVIRNAFFQKGAILPPEKTPYAYMYGDTSVETAHAFVSILEQMKKIKPDGDLLIREFFDEIDIRILYLYAMNEAEWFEEEDTNAGIYLQLAVEVCDTVPGKARFMHWIQHNVPDTYQKLRAELLDSIWQENRGMFWKGWVRQNRPEVDPDFYENKKIGSTYITNDNGMNNTEDILDGLINQRERED